MSGRFKSFLHDRRGHIAIEYGMIAALVAIGLITAIAGMGTSLESMLGRALPALSAPTP
jgi:pilus assembly protein Flp/PilA